MIPNTNSFRKLKIVLKNFKWSILVMVLKLWARVKKRGAFASQLLVKGSLEQNLPFGSKAKSKNIYKNFSGSIETKRFFSIMLKVFRVTCFKKHIPLMKKVPNVRYKPVLNLLFQLVQNYLVLCPLWNQGRRKQRIQNKTTDSSSWIFILY